MKKKYNIAIIGSGLGGLLSGAILSKYGYSVCVLEKHSVIGGNLQTFTRKGKIFSTGMHYVGSMDDGQILNKIFNFIGVTRTVEFEKLDEKCFDKICIADKEYYYSNGINNFINSLSIQFPNNNKEIENYISKLTDIWEGNPIINFQHENIESFYNNEYLSISVSEVLNSITNNEELKAVLAATNGLYAGNPDITPFYLHALINYFFIQSAYRIKYGSSLLASSLKSIIEDNNGDVITNAEVVKFNIENDTIISLITKDSRTYEADHFISNIHPSQTNILVGDGGFRKAYYNRIKSLKNTVGSFVVYVSLKKNSFKHLNHNIYYSKDRDVWAANYKNSDTSPKGYMLYTNKDNSDEKFAESATIITFMKYDEVLMWENTSIGNRGNDYKNFKEQKVRTILEIISKKFPDFENCIDGYWSSTPLTYRDYTGIPEGSMYGIMKDCTNIQNSYIHPKTKINNLYLVGQNIGFHGILGVAMNAIIVCSFFIELNLLLTEIKNYKDVENN